MVSSHGEICPKKHCSFEKERSIWLGGGGGGQTLFLCTGQREPQGKIINNFELNQLNCLSWGLHLDQVYFLAIIIMMI